LRFVTPYAIYVNVTDIKPPAPAADAHDDELIRDIELLFYAYRDFTGEADAVLERYGFGRAHHRVVHFVGQNPGMSIAELLDILRITKQSLSRVLSQLIRERLVIQQQGTRDRRQRLLYLTDAGVELFRRLSQPQKTRIARAYEEAGADAIEGYRRVLTGLINAEARAVAARPPRAR
jgi:DNA-binding MarR family transcriptional regulator